MEIRLNKIIAEAGVASRREADRLITAGEVTINGEVVTELGTKCDPENVHIKVKGKLLQTSSRKTYVLLNKPKGYVTTTKDPEGRQTVMDLIRNVPGRLYPVGRLDLQTEGLLILTNDGELADKIMKPKSKVAKIYEVKIRGTLNNNLKKKLEYGISVDGETLKAESIKTIKEDKNTWLEVTIFEGKNRHIRRLFDAIKHPVVKIRRIQIGNLKAPYLKPGEYIMLEESDIKKIFERR
jgi:23S rRNA pseudouridine2605 synthase